VVVSQLKITFNSDVSDGMQWRFTPSQKEVRCKPGQTVLAFYKAKNLSKEPITGVSTYNVTPMKAGPYFNKIQCFCFEEQRLRAGEEVDMPVFFYIVRASLCVPFRLDCPCCWASSENTRCIGASSSSTSREIGATAEGLTHARCDMAGYGRRTRSSLWIQR
jgi:hypothetical protein